MIDLSRARAVRPGLAEGGVESRVYYGLRALKVALEEIGYED